MSISHLGHWSLSGILPRLNSASTVTLSMQTRYFFLAVQLPHVLFIDSFDILPFFTCAPLVCLHTCLFILSFSTAMSFCFAAPFLLQLMPLSAFQLHTDLNPVSYYYPPFVLSNLRCYRFLLYVARLLSLFFERLPTPACVLLGIFLPNYPWPVMKF